MPVIAWFYGILIKQKLLRMWQTNEYARLPGLE